MFFACRPFFLAGIFCRLLDLAIALCLPYIHPLQNLLSPPLEAGGGGRYTVYTLETSVQGGGGRAGLFIPQHGLTCGLPALCKVSRGIEKGCGGGGGRGT